VASGGAWCLVRQMFNRDEAGAESVDLVRLPAHPDP
jgi:hypothetical protein